MDVVAMDRANSDWALQLPLRERLMTTLEAIARAGIGAIFTYLSTQMRIGCAMVKNGSEGIRCSEVGDVASMGRITKVWDKRQDFEFSHDCVTLHLSLG